jgi:hypothetical protein
LPELLSAESITSFDAAKQVQSIVGDRTYFIEGEYRHPNAKGAAVIAEATWPFVENFLKDGKLVRP